MLFEMSGLKASKSCAAVFDLKYSVAAVLPPPRIFCASVMDISRMAPAKMSAALGAAFSAARFMLRTKASTSFW